MAVRKRFIAGAKCPACQAQDSLAMWRENNVDIVECVKCGHQMREADKEVREMLRRYHESSKRPGGQPGLSGTYRRRCVG
ncbi:MAG: YheV family putative zinc ribbon protein [Klebsiella michiganensis]|nr:YheV family putative zinc ribbon protein [Klebsiella michiganensis]